MKNYTYAALDDIVATLCSRVEEIRSVANSQVEYYKRDGKKFLSTQKRIWKRNTQSPI